MKGGREGTDRREEGKGRTDGRKARKARKESKERKEGKRHIEK